MKIFTITVAFCPAAQLARTLIEYRKYSSVKPARHIIVDGHYPIDKRRNQRDIRLIAESFGNCEVLDPGEDLGSAQSQNWVLSELRSEIDDEDLFLNLDPDASCRTPGWDKAMMEVLEADPNCVLLSCNAPMVLDFVKKRNQTMGELTVSGHRLWLPDIPTPFNLSLWRISFLRTLQGIPQRFPYYGEVEGPMYMAARALGHYNAYMRDFMEDEQGKLMHHEAFEQWKDLHARQCEFMGNFSEFCESNGLTGGNNK